MQNIYTIDETAKLLKVDNKTVESWLRKGFLKGVKLSRFWRIRENDLEQFVNELPTINKYYTNNKPVVTTEMLLSENSLKETWLTPEEDEAWKNL